MRPIRVAGVAFSLLFALAAPAWAANDYSQVERCISATGSNPTYAKWIGSADSSLSFVTPTQLNLALDAGKGRTGTGTRTVNVYKLLRTDNSGLLTPVPAERDDFFPDILDLAMTRQVDSYLLEFVPQQPAGPKESCVLTFGNVWLWATRPGGTFPLTPRRESFTADKLNMTIVKQLLYKGQDGPPQSLRLEALRDGAPPILPLALLDSDPGSPVSWNGKSNSIRNISNAPLYNLWLCSPGAGLSSHPACLGLVQYQLNDDPLVIRSHSDIGTLKQTASIRGLQNGELTTFALVGSPSATVSRTYEYGGQPESPVLPEGVRGNFVTSERDLEYTVILVGSADADRLGRRCPADLSKPPTQIRVFSGGSSSAFDVNACLYVRDNQNRAWTLVPDAPEGDAPEQRLLDAMRFMLCTSSIQCTDAGFLSARTQMGFRLTDRPAQLVLQATSVRDSPMPLDPNTVTLSTVKPVYLPRLPAASLTEKEVPHMAFQTFTKSEWENQKQAACLPGDWKGQYGDGVLDASAPLLLRAGAKVVKIGDGQWKDAVIGGQELLCPELTDAQLAQMLILVRDATLAGQVAELDAIQGGQLVGRHVLLAGPTRVPISAIELHRPLAEGGGVLDSFTRRSPFPDLGRICVLTNADWGDTVYLDPSRLALRSDDGVPVATFRSLGPTPDHHPFGRPAKDPKTPDGKHWRYCAPISQGEAKPEPIDVAVIRAQVPSVDMEELVLTLDDADGCVGPAGAPHQPCARIGARTIITGTGATAVSAFHVGLAWGHEYSSGSNVPATEMRAYLALPLALFELSPRGVSFSLDTGLDIGFAGGRGLIKDTFVTRAAVPIGGYAALCFSVTALRSVIHTAPRLCGGAFVDAIAIKSTATSDATSGQIGVDGPAFVPFVSVGLGEF